MSTGPYWYTVVAVVLTIYQGYRGFMFQWILADRSKWTIPQRVILLCFADIILYVVCSVAGFVSLWLAYKLSVGIPSFYDIPAGTSVLLIFLALFGILGVAGQLPHLVQQGKLLPPRS